MTTVLLLCDDDRQAALAEEMRGQGLAVLGCTGCGQLVRDAIRLAPDVVVAWVDAPGDAQFEAFVLLAGSAPRPLLLVTADERAELMQRALEQGVDELVPAGAPPQRWPALVALAQLRHRRAEAQRQTQAGLQARLDERKWVDRAKGLLMRDNAFSEEQAFHLLRTASMHANLRVGEVSRALIEAARSADAINRAGQLRMLSQRLVKCQALALAGIDAAGMVALQQQSRQRVEGALAQLRALPLGDEIARLREPVVQAWSGLAQALDDPAPALATVDARAQALLEQADRLTSALERASGRHGLHIVNLCGRQRMLSQRLAAQALLRAAGATALEPAGRHMAEAVREFEQALLELERAPLSGEGIRPGLALARQQWLRMQEGVRGAGSRSGKALLAHESEALLASFDDLTERYERSMQVLLS